LARKPEELLPKDDVDPNLGPPDVDELLQRGPEGPEDELPDDYLAEIIEAPPAPAPRAPAEKPGRTVKGGFLEQLRKTLEGGKAVAYKGGEGDEEGEGELDEDDEEDDEEEDEDDDDSLPDLEEGPSKRSVPSSAPAKKGFLDEAFDQVAQGYRANEIGDLDDEEEPVQGPLSISAFDSVLDDFLETQKQRALLPPNSKVGLLSVTPSTEKASIPRKEERLHRARVAEPDEAYPTPAPIGTKGARKLAAERDAAAKAQQEKGKDGGKEELQDEEAEEESEEEEEEYEVVRLQQDLAYDAESIASLVSNTENHPALIAEPKRGPRRPPAPGAPAQVHEKIELSKKTGLPLGVLPGKERKKEAAAEAETESVNRGAPRKKGESADERRARKAEVRQERRQARERKKGLREAFKTETNTILRAVTTGDVPSQTSVLHF
jgi:protein LTV1